MQVVDILTDASRHKNVTIWYMRRSILYPMIGFFVIMLMGMGTLAFLGSLNSNSQDDGASTVQTVETVPVDEQPGTTTPQDIKDNVQYVP
jgi:hypothetical protein